MFGEVPEWLNGAVSKTVVRISRTEGSNPSLSAMFYVYVIHSKTAKRYYIGQTKNLSERIKTHNKGKVRSTKAFRPWELCYFEEFETRSEAVRRETYFKSYEGRNWLIRQKIILPKESSSGRISRTEGSP